MKWGVLLLPFVATLALAQEPAKDAAKDSARAEEIVAATCFGCHGAEGEGSTARYPRLAAQHAAYVARQLADYKSGRRKSSVMRPMVAPLSDADFQALGQWFERQSARSHVVKDTELAAAGRSLFEAGKPDTGVPACTSCHGPQGHGTETLPRLAGQHAQYTLNQLQQFDKRERTNDNAVMHQIASKLSEREMRAVAAYVSGLK